MGSVYFNRGDYQDALTFYQQALQLREKLRVPAEIAVSVHNLGDTTVKMGQFDQALTQYVRALEIYRKSGDKRDAAIEIHSTATVFACQGRYGAALNAEEEALKVFRGLQDRSFWMGDILSGYGNALSLVGRSEEAQENLEEALGVARDIKSEPLIAQILNYQGDLSFYRSDLKSAKSQYQQALRMASQTSDQEKALIAKINLAKVAAEEGRSREPITALKALTERADVLGLKSYSVECSVYLTEAMINAKDYVRAREQLEHDLGKSEKLGVRMQTARIHHLLGTALRLGGNPPEAAPHYATALRLLGEMQKEPGVEHITDRADVHAIYTDSVRWSTH